MKEICKEYYEEIKKLLTNKIYVFAVILVTILAYGFTITNLSIGVDDLCFDRYVTGPYILSAGRWGTTALYSLFQIYNFTPFWLELIVTLLTVFMGIVFTAYLKKQLLDKMKNVVYCIITTTILISYPVLHQSFIYQSTNLSVIICNLVLMILPIMIYENYKKHNSFINYAWIVVVLPFFISMYESCCQTFILMTCIISFFEIYNNKKDKETTINVIKYIGISILTLMCGLILNACINKMIKIALSYKQLLTLDFSSKSIPWIKYEISTVLKLLENNVLNKLFIDFQKTQFVREFIIFAILTLVIIVIKSIKDKKFILIPFLIVIIFSNFAVNLLQARILYRVDTSWCLAIAFFAAIILINISDKGLNKALCLVFCLVIFSQTKQMNQYFYNDYVRYQREANYATYIANEIITKCEDTTKPIVYLTEEKDGIHQNQINQDNGWSLIDWGAKGAFGEYGSEITKFINSFGYSFTVATNEEIEKSFEDYKNKVNVEYSGIVYEANDYIIVKLNYNI